MPADDGRDEIDNLFARLERAASPDDFLARVMARAREGEVARWARWQRMAFGVLYVAALLGLGVLAYLTGGELEHSQARELITIALQDLSAVKDSPGLYLTALRDAIPWLMVAAVLADIAVLGVATHLLFKAAGSWPHKRSGAAA